MLAFSALQTGASAGIPPPAVGSWDGPAPVVAEAAGASPLACATPAGANPPGGTARGGGGVIAALPMGDCAGGLLKATKRRRGGWDRGVPGTGSSQQTVGACEQR